MPEGDTVFRAARRLDEALAGREVERFELRVPRAATVDLTGETVQGVVARGKHLLMRIGTTTVHSHLKMEGEWHVYRRGERWRQQSFKARAIVGTAVNEAVGFDLAEVTAVPTADEEALVGYLGPDLLGPDWDADEAIRRLARDDRPAHVALLDQRNLAGLGNEYVNELLFVRGILPARPLVPADLPGVVATGSAMIRANRDRHGRTFTGDARPGRTDWVYRREHRPCRRCGTLIEGGSLGADPTKERIVFWCPRCQT